MIYKSASFEQVFGYPVQKFVDDPTFFKQIVFPDDMEVVIAARNAALRVTDAGIGIPPEDLQHLFQPFHRAANVGSIQGTGLGLAIVKEAVELHGGTIAVESQVGEGTTFIVTLPASLPGTTQSR